MIVHSGKNGINLLPVTELARFIREKFDKEGARGEQAKFARKTKISDGTISRWKQDRSPTFESCLLIADYFGLSPLRVFEMGELSDYANLYRRFFPEYQKQTVSESDLYPQEHVKAHQMLQRILQDGSEADFIILSLRITDEKVQLGNIQKQLPDPVVDAVRRIEEERQAEREGVKRKKEA